MIPKGVENVKSSESASRSQFCDPESQREPARAGSKYSAEIALAPKIPNVHQTWGNTYTQQGNVKPMGNTQIKVKRQSNGAQQTRESNTPS